MSKGSCHIIASTQNHCISIDWPAEKHKPLSLHISGDIATNGHFSLTRLGGCYVYHVQCVRTEQPLQVDNGKLDLDLMWPQQKLALGGSTELRVVSLASLSHSHCTGRQAQQEGEVIMRHPEQRRCITRMCITCLGPRHAANIRASHNKIC